MPTPAADLDRAEIERQLDIDLKTLRTVVPGLDALEARWNDARMASGATARGYFTPEEDDRVRQMLLAYRNYRVALHEIIFRCWQYVNLPWPDLQLRMFLVGFATGLTLYSKSLKLIEAYERVPLVRKKINEPDSKFEMEAGFFDRVLAAYSSLGNYRGIARGTWFWLQHRREIQHELRRGENDSKWLVEVILRERTFTRKRLGNILRARLRYDWRLFLRSVFKPVQKTQYNIKAIIGSAGANLRTTGHYRPSLKPSTISRLHTLLKPGDVLLVRAEKKVTSAILPGFWAHAALYVGTPNSLQSLGIIEHPHVARHLANLTARDKGLGCAIEAINPAVQLTPLQHCLFVDHVMVLRPNLPPAQIVAALIEAFGHVGKPYDYEFDFNVSTRIVCTELIYRCYHQKGTIKFPLIKRLGRFTLSGDDIATGLVESLSHPGEQPFDVVALVLGTGDGQAQFIDTAEVLSTLRKIQSGWKPTSVAHSVPH